MHYEDGYYVNSLDIELLFNLEKINIILKIRNFVIFIDFKILINFMLLI